MIYDFPVFSAQVEVEVVPMTSGLIASCVPE